MRSRKIHDIHVETKSPAAAQPLKEASRPAVCDRSRHQGQAAGRAPRRASQGDADLSELRAFLDATMEKISNENDLASAFRYATSRWTALTRYVGDGRPRKCPTDGADKRNRQPGVAVMAGAVGGFSSRRHHSLVGFPAQRAARSRLPARGSP